MRALGHTISIQNNTNRAICGSESDWSQIRPGSFIRFAQDDVLYTVAKTNQIFYIKDAVVGADGRKLIINDDIGINLHKGDCLTVSYKEYTLLTLLEIADGGSNYRVEDIISLNGGITSPEQSSGRPQLTAFRVTSVDENGKITGLALHSLGLYLVTPTSECKVDGGNGSNAKLLVEFKLVDNRRIVDRIVNKIDYSPAQSSLYLNYPMPAGLSEAKISVNKWEVILTGNYIGESLIDSDYKVSRDFTPNLGLPMMVRNSLSTDLLYNNSIQTLDLVISELQAQVKELQEKIKTLS